MALHDRLPNSVRSLTAALDLLDAALERRAQAESIRADLDHELILMAEDRARLADDLDASLARSDGLEAASRTVAERLDRMGAACAVLLGRAVPGESPSEP